MGCQHCPCSESWRVLSPPPRIGCPLFGLAGWHRDSILTPPLKGGDERDHFTRAYQISTGSILTHRQGPAYGADPPRSFQVEEERLVRLSYLGPDLTVFLGDLGQASASGPTEFVSAGNAASYGPGAYIDYSVTIALGRLLGLSTLVLLYLARTAGVVTYALLLSLAIRRIPTHPWVLVAVGLLPTALNQASTVSADGMTMALSFLLVAEALRLSLDEGAPRRRILIESALAAAVLALAKPPYYALVVLFAVPAWRYRRQLARPLLAIGVGTLGLAGVWSSYQAAKLAFAEQRQDLAGRTSQSVRVPRHPDGRPDPLRPYPPAVVPPRRRPHLRVRGIGLP